ncbi:MAG TPA: hypothetical protein VNW04_03050 [Puia sp.]|jgi:hypothetical protein|nr:hypothetical protein [Puia sp.]
MIREVRKIAQKVLVLGWDILLFTWDVVRRVILPTRRRRGNLLSSLLTFFLGLVERIVSFEKSILQRPVVFTHKYVKQGLIIAVGLLFLLSSFEWTIGLSPDTQANGSTEVVACAPMGVAVRLETPRRMAFSVRVPSAGWEADRDYRSSRSLSRCGPPLKSKRWLRFRVFRV